MVALAPGYKIVLHSALPSRLFYISVTFHFYDYGFVYSASVRYNYRMSIHLSEFRNLWAHVTYHWSACGWPNQSLALYYVSYIELSREADLPHSTAQSVY